MKTERKIAELIFDRFRKANCKTNEIVMMNTIRHSLLDQLNPKEKDTFNVVFVGLQALDYYTYHTDSPECIRLTQKGYDYIYDDEKIKKMNSISWIIPQYEKTDWEKAYNKLWRIIGPQDSAIFYIKGPQFYKFVTDLCEAMNPSYSKYLDSRNKKELSTSRVDYYKDLIELLDEEKRYELYVNIQMYLESTVLDSKETTLDIYADLLDEISYVEPMLKSEKKEENNIENAPKVFISYSWDDEKHINWVVTLATKLMENGIEVLLDQWKLKLGKPLPYFMEQSIDKADRVICVMTPNYRRKTDNLVGGVGSEYSIISADIIKNINTEKYIPLFREGSDVPAFLSGRNFVDMRDDNLFDDKLDELVRDIWNEPKYKKPIIGTKPKF